MSRFVAHLVVLSWQQHNGGWRAALYVERDRGRPPTLPRGCRPIKMWSVMAPNGDTAHALLVQSLAGVAGNQHEIRPGMGMWPEATLYSLRSEGGT